MSDFSFFRTLIIDTLMSVAERNWNCMRGVKNIVEFFKKMSRDQMAMGWKLAKYKGKENENIRWWMREEWHPFARWPKLTTLRQFRVARRALTLVWSAQMEGLRQERRNKRRQLCSQQLFNDSATCCTNCFLICFFVFSFFQSWNHVTRWGGNSGLIDQLSRVLTKG